MKTQEGLDTTQAASRPARLSPECRLCAPGSDLVLDLVCLDISLVSSSPEDILPFQNRVLPLAARAREALRGQPAGPRPSGPDRAMSILIFEDASRFMNLLLRDSPQLLEANRAGVITLILPLGRLSSRKLAK